MDRFTELATSCQQLRTMQLPLAHCVQQRTSTVTWALNSDSSVFRVETLLKPQQGLAEGDSVVRWMRPNQRKLSGQIATKPHNNYAAPDQALLAALQTALPLPAEPLLGIMSLRGLQETLFINIPLAGSPDNRIIFSPLVLVGCARQNFVSNFIHQPGRRLPQLWEAIKNQTLVSLTSLFSNSYIIKGKIRNQDAIIIDGYLYAHPETWRRMPNATPRDVTQKLELTL